MTTRDKWYPRQKLSNPNTPKGAIIIGSIERANGVVIETFYIIDGETYYIENTGNAIPHKFNKGLIDENKWGKHLTGEDK